MRQTMRLTKVELRRLLMNKKTYILMCLNILFIGIGFVPFLKDIVNMLGITLYFGSSNSGNIINPFCLGGLSGSIIWGFSIVFDSDRFRANGITDMVNAYTKEENASLARVLSYVVVVSITYLIGVFIYLPVCSQKLDYLFDYGFYFTYTVLCMYAGIIITIFLCEGLYNITKNVIVVIMLFMGLTAIQFSNKTCNKTFLRWSVPQFGNVSDAYGSIGMVRIQIYTRIMFLVLAIGIWAVSVLFIRKYKLGPVKSFLINARKVSRFVAPVLFLGFGVFLYIKEPFIDHSPVVEWVEGEQDTKYYGGFSKSVTNLEFNYLLGTLKGETVMNLIEAPEDYLTFTINSGIKVKNVTLDGERLPYSVDYDWDDQFNMNLAVFKGVIRNPEKKTGELRIEYEGYPAISNSSYQLIGYDMYDSIGRNYIKLSRETVRPEFTNVFINQNELYINVPKNHTPLSSGYELSKIRDNQDGTVCWKLVDAIMPEIVSAENHIDEVDYSRKKTVFEYGSRYGDVVKENNMTGAAGDVLEFCDKHIGKLKTDESKSIRIQQLSYDYSGGGAINGWIFMDETFLSPETLSDKNAGSNMNEIFMHEIVHLFWGDLGCYVEDDGTWSAEGLDVYTVYRIVKEKYGELYAKQYYEDVWKENVKNLNNNFYYRHPEYLDKLPDSYRVNILNGVDGLKKYNLMPLMLLKAEEKLGGEEAMDAVLQKLYAEGHGNSFDDTPGVTFQDFLDTAGLTKEDLELE